MILQRLYSKTYERITNPEKRTEKAKEILEKRKKFHDSFKLKERIDEINNKYLEDLQKAAKGEPVSVGKDGPKFLNAKELAGRRENAIQNAESYWKEFYNINTEGVSRKALAKEKEEARKKAEIEAKTIGARLKKAGSEAKKFAKENKKGLIIGGSVAAASGLALGGSKVYNHYKDREKSQDIRKKVRGYDSSKKK